jgi:hypothetical protein
MGWITMDWEGIYGRSTGSWSKPGLALLQGNFIPFPQENISLTLSKKFLSDLSGFG